jgi:hypothetical protein
MPQAEIRATRNICDGIMSDEITVASMEVMRLSPSHCCSSHLQLEQELYSVHSSRKRGVQSGL